MRWLILLFFFLLLIQPSSAYTQEQVCVRTYQFIIENNGSYNLLDINTLNRDLQINNSEEYILNFNGLCGNYLQGILANNQSFLESYKDFDDSCEFSIPKVFSISYPTGNSVNIGEFSCGTTKWMNYLVETDGDYLAGVRVWWLVVLLILVIVLTFTIKRALSKSQLS